MVVPQLVSGYAALARKPSTESLLDHIDLSNGADDLDGPSQPSRFGLFDLARRISHRLHLLPTAPTPALAKSQKRKHLRTLWLFCLPPAAVGGVFVVLAFLGVLSTKIRVAGALGTPSAKPQTTHPNQPPAPVLLGRPVSLDQVLNGTFKPRHQEFTWARTEQASGAEFVLQKSTNSEDDFYIRSLLVSSDSLQREAVLLEGTRTLIKTTTFSYDGQYFVAEDAWVSPDLNAILLVTNVVKIWRHSFTGLYWLLDIETQTVEPLDPEFPGTAVQLACWSPASDSVAFVREGNLYLRSRDSRLPTVTVITKDANDDVSYGIPDWVYEEEVFEDRRALWWSSNGRFIAFLRMDDSLVGQSTLQYITSNPRAAGVGTPSFISYPWTRTYKYPKPGTPNPVVQRRIYDTQTTSTWSADIPGELADADRIIFDMLWLNDRRLLVKQTDRQSDILQVLVLDALEKTGQMVRSENISNLDGGWVEPLQSAKPVPADPDRGRPHDGYIDTIIHDGYNHLAYFTPLNSTSPAVLLTSGKWQVVDAPAAVDLRGNVVYFVAARPAPGARGLYRVNLDGKGLESVTGETEEAYCTVDFSPSANYAAITFHGPQTPWQSFISLSPKSGLIEHEQKIERNERLSQSLQSYALPRNVYHTVNQGGEALPLVERLPPGFDPSRRYPTVFYLYGGPGSQKVNLKFKVDFQAYLSAQGYVVVTLDGRGTGFNGRRAQGVVRGRIGHLEALDQIAAAKIWSKKSYVDSDRMAVYGWSFGGFLALKTLETDAGETFRYGMAVAPVTDWRYYDSIHTERHMHTPKNNPGGYEDSAISNMAALNGTVRFLVAHGTADDNVHVQNTLSLVDKLDMAGVASYDLLIYPDSAHDITARNGENMIHRRLTQWLANAFNGQWERVIN